MKAKNKERKDKSIMLIISTTGICLLGKLNKKHKLLLESFQRESVQVSHFRNHKRDNHRATKDEQINVTMLQISKSKLKT